MPRGVGVVKGSRRNSRRSVRMATSKKFRSPGGGHVSIYVPWRETPIEVPAEGTYETSDPQEIEALQASSEVQEYKQAAPKKAEPKADSPKADEPSPKAEPKADEPKAADPAPKAEPPKGTGKK
jgi:hypothetical protein